MNMKKKVMSDYEHHKIMGENSVCFAKMCERNNDQALARDYYYIALNEFEKAFLVVKSINYEKALMMNEKMCEMLDKIKKLEFVAEKAECAER